MSADPRKIVVTESCCGACDVHTVRVHHQIFPELRVEGLSAEIAAGHLRNRLAASRETVPDDSHREAVQGAIDDLQAFLDRQGADHPARDIGT